MCEYVQTKKDRVIVEKGWGYEEWIWNEEYCGKMLFFNAGKRCSYHYHVDKDEILYLHSGMILMKYGECDDISKSHEVLLTPGMSFHVVKNLRHQMIAMEDSLIYEFSTHHEDSDSYRSVVGD